MKRGIATHDASTMSYLEKLHGEQSRNPVAPHAGVASVGTPGAKPTAPSVETSDANKVFNDATKQGGPNMRPNVVMVGGR